MILGFPSGLVLAFQFHNVDPPPLVLELRLVGSHSTLRTYVEAPKVDDDTTVACRIILRQQPQHPPDSPGTFSYSTLDTECRWVH